MPVEKKGKSESINNLTNSCQREKSKTSSINSESNSSAVQINALNHESRRSAFSPYRVSFVSISILFF